MNYSPLHRGAFFLSRRRNGHRSRISQVNVPLRKYWNSRCYSDLVIMNFNSNSTAGWFLCLPQISVSSWNMLPSCCLYLCTSMFSYCQKSMHKRQLFHWFPLWSLASTLAILRLMLLMILGVMRLSHISKSMTFCKVAQHTIIYFPISTISVSSVSKSQFYSEWQYTVSQLLFKMFVVGILKDSRA